MSTLHDICNLIEARAAAEDDLEFVRLGEVDCLRHADAFWDYVERLLSVPATSVEELFLKVQAAQLIFRHRRERDEPFSELLRDLVAESATVEDRLLFSIFADVSTLAESEAIAA